MRRYVVHKGVHCQVFEHGWKVKQWVNPDTGQAEHMAWKKLLYVPMGDWDDADIHAQEIDQSGTLLGQQQEEERRLRALEKSAARAKRTCRMKIKSAGMKSLLTCTYRENMQDFDRARTDFHAFLRKLRNIIPDFAAVYAFERQGRGAWHVHAAIRQLPEWLVYTEKFTGKQVKVRSWAYIRRLWHSVVGKDNGNVDIDGHRKTRHGFPAKHRPAESLAKLAGYVSKYLTKGFEDGLEGRNRWGSTQGIGVPKPVVIELPEMPLADLISITFEVPDGHRIVRHNVSQFGKFWLLYTEPGADFST